MVGGGGGWWRVFTARHIASVVRTPPFFFRERCVFFPWCSFSYRIASSFVFVATNDHNNDGHIFALLAAILYFIGGDHVRSFKMDPQVFAGSKPEKRAMDARDGSLAHFVYTKDGDNGGLIYWLGTRRSASKRSWAFEAQLMLSVTP